MILWRASRYCAPLWLKAIFSLLFSFLFWTRDKSFLQVCEGSEGRWGVEGGGAGKWTRADCRLCVCLPGVFLPSVPSSFRTEPSSLAAGQASSCFPFPCQGN